MTRIPIDVGSIVRSKAGRDSGRLFLVIAQPDPQHVLLVDGDLRRVEKPKRKKRRHLEPTVLFCQSHEIGKLKNSDVRKLIHNATDKEG
jgi:large subunit ribosomal protein L14e